MNERKPTCVITGASAGIGKATAIAMAKLGYSVIMLVRDCDKSRVAADVIKAESGSDDVRMVYVDLASHKSIADAVGRIAKIGVCVDVLVNNAGVYKRSREISVDGIEMTLAVNFVAMYMLTNLLLPLMNRESGARIINLTSELYKSANIELDNYVADGRFSGSKAYANSKLLVVVFTPELARRLEGSGITANCVHPGVVGTDVFREYPRWFSRMVNLFISKPEDGAAPVVYLATSPEVENETGRYYNKMDATPISGVASDDGLGDRVWSYGETLSALGDTEAGSSSTTDIRQKMA